MLIEKNTAIITYIDDLYEENLEKDFLPSLIDKGKFRGIIWVIDYGIDSEIKSSIIEKYNVCFLPYKKDRPVFSLRYQHIPEVINALPQNITHVLLVDGGDIWFQKPIAPIFEASEKKIGYVEEPDIIGKNEWISMCLSNLDSEVIYKIMSNSEGKKNKNSGMICGPRNEVYSLCKNVFEDMIDVGFEFFGLDQLFFNYEINKLSNKKTVALDMEYNYVLITNPDFIYQNQKIYTQDGRLVTVVHNAGGNWRVFNKKYNFSKKEELQYFCSELREWNLMQH